MTLSLSGSSAIAVAISNQPYTLTCKVTKAAYSNHGIRFFKANDADEIVVIIQTVGRCSIGQKPKAGYLATCGDGTDAGSAAIKEYNLNILNVSYTSDRTTWWCTSDKPIVTSNNFTLEVKGKLP